MYIGGINVQAFLRCGCFMSCYGGAFGMDGISESETDK